MQSISSYDSKLVISRWGSGQAYEPEINSILLFGGFSFDLNNGQIVAIAVDNLKVECYENLENNWQASHVYRSGVLLSFGGWGNNSFQSELKVTLISIYDKYLSSELKRKAELPIPYHDSNNPKIIAQSYALENLPPKARKVRLRFAHNEEG